MDDQGGNFVPAEREPFFKAPWPSIAIIGALGAAFLLQLYVVPEAVQVRLALSPAALRNGALWTLVSYQFLHGGWTHFLMNAASALAFGPPVARLFGERGLGPIWFFGFFLVCGIVAGLGFCLIHPATPGLILGASGAISGLWGAASRLLAGGGRPAPILSRPVISQAVAFVIINVVVGMVGLFGMLNIAWEAHLFGYACGLLLIGPAQRLTSND